MEGWSMVRRILVVDDDADINRLLRARISARGYRVTGAADGEEALEYLLAESPDIIFLDVSMPGIDGLEVLDKVRTRRLDTAVVMTTAFGSEQVAIDALRRGADDYLRKPFETSEFQAVLERTVQRLELGRQNSMLRRQLDEKRQQLEAELARAGRVQADLLPIGPPTLAGYDLAGLCIPARVTGGDFYDWETVEPGIVALTLGDVMGKGMPAALLMATVRAAVRASIDHAPGDAVTRVARALGTDLDRAKAFVTLFHARVECATGDITFIDAGHGHVFVRRATGTVEALGPRGLPLGIDPTFAYEEGQATLDRGDVMVLYSDGVVDNRAGIIEPRHLAATIEDAGSASDIAERIRQLTVTAIDGAPPDDITIVVLARRSGDV
jgi:serine phosphatase RsbU (regulator of sigma subunit)